MIRVSYNYYVTQVKKKPTSKGMMTSFSIKDEIRNADANKKHCWWNMIVWEDVDIKDNDMVTLLEIEGMGQSFYNGKTFSSYFCKVKKYDPEAIPDEEYPDIDK
jgi:hypothetical protein